MRIVITGATGFVGHRLVERLKSRGHALRAWVRSPASAARTLGADVELIDASGGGAAMQAAIDDADAIVNLAGEPVIGRRWSAAQKQALRASRIGVTDLIVDAIAAAPRPRVLVSTSAVGYYGDTGAREVDEDSAPGNDFLAALTIDWEAAALRAERHQTRVCLVRIGLVLGRDGGVLGKLLPPFRLGLGGPIGDGKQYFPWVHIDDLIGMQVAALEREDLHGPLLAVAPGIVTNREFGAALGRALHRPAVLRVPAFALRLALGESASALLNGQRAVPRRTQALGYEFQFPELEPALADLLG
ncbi:MAG: TIGR01777 family protein [Nannocystis sp.]|nr:TIGR01777 family oxidoreductase [Nannocystis sp.]MBA3550190.1 TIGR01777 family protein [Nannocystis sp.]